jgi:TPP-dependent pyruvate/acetoin dehydrogenase alpha subunit
MTAPPVGVSSASAREMYRQMQRIRRLEEEIALCAERHEIGGPTHLYIGQEAVAVGVCSALRSDDLICGGHRSHGHYLAKGGSMRELAAEIFGRATGCAGGRGGSMHLVDTSIGLLGTSALVGGGMGVGVGAALANSLAGNDRVSAIFFGDGAVEEGVFAETLNFAALKKLPVIYVCENNLYSSHMPIASRQPVGEIWRFAEPYGIPGIRLDGNDVFAVYTAATDAVKRARRGDGPTLLECMTYRWRGHVGPAWDLDKGLRTQAEVNEWMIRSPITRLGGNLETNGEMSPAERARIEAEVDAEVDDAIAFAKASPLPDPSTLLDGVYR